MATTKKSTIVKTPQKNAEKSKPLVDPSDKGPIIALLRKTERAGIESLIDYLEKSDFFVAPASTQYHGSYEGGLAEHSLNVLDALISLYEFYVSAYQTPTIPEDSLILVALLHDLCKINCYHEDFRNVKNDQGVWEKVPTYKREPLFPMGHGGKSVFIAQSFISLTSEEAQAIYWHMGAYDTSDYNTYNELSQAFNQNALAFLLNQADMTSTYIIENKLYQQ